MAAWLPEVGYMAYSGEDQPVTSIRVFMLPYDHHRYIFSVNRFNPSGHQSWTAISRLVVGSLAIADSAIAIGGVAYPSVVAASGAAINRGVASNI